MRSDGKKNSCFRLVFIESFSRFRRFYWIILMILSVIFRGDSSDASFPYIYNKV